MKKLNLGCGAEYKDNWINIDINSKYKTDILCDIEQGIPLEDNSINFIFIKHVLEHIHPKKLSFVMSEINRICTNNAKIIIYCPYFSCSITYKTWEHITQISYYTFNGFKDFDVIKKKLFFFRESFNYKNVFLSKILRFLNPVFSFLPNSFPLIYERLFCWIFPMEEIFIELRVKK